MHAIMHYLHIYMHKRHFLPQLYTYIAYGGSFVTARQLKLFIISSSVSITKLLTSYST